MNVGMVGLGKLGLPCLLAIEKHSDHKVFGYDVSNEVINSVRNKSVTYWEEGVNELLKESEIELVDSPEVLVEKCDIIFMAVQTPHDPEFEGKTPTPNSRKDFDYSYIISAAEGLANGLLQYSQKNPLIVVISTVLPGTMKNKIIPILSDARKDFKFAYNPYFIAMGTTIFDFLNPEFILIGANNKDAANQLEDFYSFLNKKCSKMDIESAELTKVAYNTFIGFKIIFANALSEIVESRGGNVDSVTDALAQADRRLMSGSYMKAGMGDGGGCHPRDQIAMSWLAQEVDMSFDIFDFIARARDAQTLRQAKMIDEYCKKQNWKPVLLGVSYKPNSPLDIGSPARLLEFYLKQIGYSPTIIDSWIYPENTNFPEKSIYFVSSRHAEYASLTNIKNSIILDPWGHVEKIDSSSKLVRIGRTQ
jgi:UDPglucose 6-dehydrogenase